MIPSSGLVVVLARPSLAETGLVRVGSANVRRPELIDAEVSGERGGEPAHLVEDSVGRAGEGEQRSGCDVLGNESEQRRRRNLAPFDDAEPNQVGQEPRGLGRAWPCEPVPRSCRVPLASRSRSPASRSQPW